MGILNWLGIKPKEELEPVPTEMTNAPEEDNENEVSPDEEKKADDKRFITVVWGTGMPIDVIFNSIHKNFEEDGFQDALVNSDIAYRDTKERIIRADLEMLFERIILRYKKEIREIDVRINDTRNALALSATNQLQARRDTCEEHLAKIYEMQKQFANNDPRMTTMIESYRRGFQKGVAAASTDFYQKN